MTMTRHCRPMGTVNVRGAAMEKAVLPYQKVHFGLYVSLGGESSDGSPSPGDSQH